MKIPARPLITAAIFSLLTALAPSLRADLSAYVKRPEPSFQWKVADSGQSGGCDYWKLALTSQVWQDIPWEHDLVILRPQGGSATETVYLVNSGGRARSREISYAAMLSQRIKAPVAFLLGVPNQPLFGGKVEDTLIAETFVRYLESGDPNWPLLLPMTKSVVKAMDAIEEFSLKQWQQPARKFIVGGASKRGWTTWLTAAVDPRVIAITPMVIDVLNMREQLPHQVACFGGPSEQIAPYTERGLVPLPDTREAETLWQMVDPWTYRERYTMPKLIVLGNNDRYWAPDALNLYWDGLPGPKYISYSPNAGHDLMEKLPGGEKAPPFRAINNICAFVRHILIDNPMPEIRWEHTNSPEGARLEVRADHQPQEARLWKAVSPTRDFRESVWESTPVSIQEGRVEVTVPRPESGYVAFFADIGYEIDEIPQWLCTQLRIIGTEVTPPPAR